jgi:hypothetical protein
LKRSFPEKDKQSPDALIKLIFDYSCIKPLNIFVGGRIPIK